jgi:hypothetical protein
MSPSPSSEPGANKKLGWKKRLVRELIEYWTNVLYLAVFFGAFAWYRRLILAGYEISYLNYGAAVIEALIMAKVILIGQALGLSRGFEDRPLIFPTLYKAVLFSLFVGVFAVVEHLVTGLVRGKSLEVELNDLLSEGKYEMLARCMVTFLAFIPFFAVQELAQVLGEGKLRTLFFRARTAAESSGRRGSD